MPHVIGAFDPSPRVSSEATLDVYERLIFGSREFRILGSLDVGKSLLVNMLIGRAVTPLSTGIDTVHLAIVPIYLAEVSGDVGAQSQSCTQTLRHSGVGTSPLTLAYDQGALKAQWRC